MPRPSHSVPTTARPLAVALRGAGLLSQPLLNKDAAFPEDEREAFGLRGLLPAGVPTLAQQVAVELEHLRRKPDDLERYIGLAALQDRNETLFYRLLLDHIEELAPIVYTPTVGAACRQYSHVMRRPRGLWITPADAGRIPELLRNSSRGDVRLIVATDNERILGLGDQGAGGIGIPIGKLALYTAGAGIHPSATLPVSLDVGTDDPSLLADPDYCGVRHPRLRGQAYERLIAAFVAGVQEVYPHALLQWEDFKQHNAIRLLDRYRAAIPSFNDDIQGTGAVALAGIRAALRATGEPLPSQRFVFLGAGAAGIGMARLIRLAMAEAGASERTLRGAVAMCDSRGLLFEGRGSMEDDKQPFALDRAALADYGFPAARGYDLATVVEHVAPTVLIGTSGQPGAFTEDAVRAMAARTAQPIIMPLSNPTDKTEATPRELLEWTGGRALVATGSPFGAVEVEGERRVIGQANNMFVFPGVGLGAVVAEAREVTDRMFLAAAEALAAAVSRERLVTGALYPPIGSLREVSRAIAVAVARAAAAEGVGQKRPDGEVEAAVAAAQWDPQYVPYRYVKRGGRAGARPNAAD